MNGFNYGFRIVGPCSGERRLIDWGAAYAAYATCDPLARYECEGYLSAFTFSDDFRIYINTNGSPKGYAGPTYAQHLGWDVDRKDNLEQARADTLKLAQMIVPRYGIPEEDLLIFFSGCKGFHLELSTNSLGIQPSMGCHSIARKFCENVADRAGVIIDTGIYDAVRPFRAPNSKHPRTGWHKICISFDTLMHQKLSKITERAKSPEPFEIPTLSSSNPTLLEDWNKAADEVRQVSEIRSSLRVASAKAGTAISLNRLTMDFIRNGAPEGERAKRLYSAARNLGENGCPLVLTHALLEESALDSGLRPQEVNRQIECGVNDAMAAHGEGGAR